MVPLIKNLFKKRKKGDRTSTDAPNQIEDIHYYSGTEYSSNPNLYRKEERGVSSSQPSQVPTQESTEALSTQPPT
jgi:hypothetical protein